MDEPKSEAKVIPVSREQQAFTLNTLDLKKQFERLDNLDKSSSVGLNPHERNQHATLFKTVESIDHTDRWFKGQPHDKKVAGEELSRAMKYAKDRANNMRNNPDDATAALNDLTLLAKAQKQLESEI